MKLGAKRCRVSLENPLGSSNEFHGNVNDYSALCHTVKVNLILAEVPLLGTDKGLFRILYFVGFTSARYLMDHAAVLFCSLVFKPFVFAVSVSVAFE